MKQPEWLLQRELQQSFVLYGYEGLQEWKARSNLVSKGLKYLLTPTSYEWERRGWEQMNPGDRISTIKGIGAKTESHLARIGIYTVGDMAEHYPCLLYTSRTFLRPMPKELYWIFLRIGFFVGDRKHSSSGSSGCILSIRCCAVVYFTPYWLTKIHGKSIITA